MASASASAALNDHRRWRHCCSRKDVSDVRQRTSDLAYRLSDFRSEVRCDSTLILVHSRHRGRSHGRDSRASLLRSRFALSLTAFVFGLRFSECCLATLALFVDNGRLTNCVSRTHLSPHQVSSAAE